MSGRYAICPICQAACGLSVDVEGNRVTRVRGHREDPLSRGHVCPKGIRIGDLHTDPDRVLNPLRREGERWVEVSWDAALDEVADRIASLQRLHGRDAAGLYVGNPTAHNHATLITLPLLIGALGSRNYYTSNSMDALPRLLAAQLVFGSPLLLPTPDLDRTAYLLIVGGNPVVSGGSVMTSPGVTQRLKGIRARGGRLVVVDPRRTETAALADEHCFIRPGADGLLLAAMVQVLLSRPSLELGALASRVEGLDELRRAVADLTPERVAAAVGIHAATIRRLASELADAESSICYGRMGICTQEFGALCSWLIDVINCLTGNVDRPGGVLVPTPPVDVAGLASRFGFAPSFADWRTRVDGLPEFNGEAPVAALPGEIETPGPGRLRSLVTLAGNPVLAAPNGRRMDRALAGLDFMVSVDSHVNESTRHARLLLPPAVGLERPNFPAMSDAVAVRNTARYGPALVTPPPGVRPDWEILAGLSSRLLARRGGAARLGAWIAAALAHGVGPERLIALAIRLGPHGLAGGRGLSLHRIRQTTAGLDLGPLTPRMAALLGDRPVRLTPPVLVRDLDRLRRRWLEPGFAPAPEGLVLIGRRQRKTLNTWMHNNPRLMRGTGPCTLHVHPRDAARLSLAAGDRVRVTSRIGSVETTVELTESVMEGVVCLPHGYGHHRPGVRLSVASRRPGVSMNDVNDDRHLDPVSGASGLTGTAVRVERLPD